MSTPHSSPSERASMIRKGPVKMNPDKDSLPEATTGIKSTSMSTSSLPPKITKKENSPLHPRALSNGATTDGATRTSCLTPKPRKKKRSDGLPPKAYTSYTIFWCLELAHMKQTAFSDGDGELDWEAEHHDPYHHDPLEFPRPDRYKHILMPPFWYSSAHKKQREKSRKHRKKKGRMDMRTMSKKFSHGWRTAEKDVIEYCERLSRAEHNKYMDVIAAISERNHESRKGGKGGETNGMPDPSDNPEGEEIKNTQHATSTDADGALQMRSTKRKVYGNNMSFAPQLSNTQGRRLPPYYGHFGWPNQTLPSFSKNGAVQYPEMRDPTLAMAAQMPTASVPNFSQNRYADSMLDTTRAGAYDATVRLIEAGSRSMNMAVESTKPASHHEGMHPLTLRNINDPQRLHALQGLHDQTTATGAYYDTAMQHLMGGHTRLDNMAMESTNFASHHKDMRSSKLPNNNSQRLRALPGMFDQGDKQPAPVVHTQASMQPGIDHQRLGAVQGLMKLDQSSFVKERESNEHESQQANVSNTAPPSPVPSSIQDKVSKAATSCKNPNNAKGTQKCSKDDSRTIHPKHENPISLLLQSDFLVLDPAQNFIRCNCIELYETGESDTTPTSVFGTSWHAPRVGQVALCCYYCKTKVFPPNLDSIFETVENFQHHHLPTCPSMPAKMKAKYEALLKEEMVLPSKQRSQPPEFLKAYYAEAASNIGIIDKYPGISFGGTSSDASIPSRTLLALIDIANSYP